MTGAIQRHHEIWHEQHSQHDQQEIPGNAQIWRFWLKAMAPVDAGYMITP
jgi:hypothetical protein